MSDASAELAGAPSVRVILTTAPPGKARDLAAALVEERLAACVNLVPGLRSLYRWEGSLRDDPETLLVIKTTAERAGDVARRIRALHSYELPEVLVLGVEGGSAGYVEWVARESRAGD
jgi:periplasmic divalent cation tolerance protein